VLDVKKVERVLLRINSLTRAYNGQTQRSDVGSKIALPMKPKPLDRSSKKLRKIGKSNETI